MVYDCFTFFNELDLLEIRLNILNDVVDKFVIVEANKTFSNKEKPLYFLDNIDRFEKFKNKIIHIIVDDFPEFEDAWAYEYFQRNAIRRGLVNCRDEDSIIISDLDEIPNPRKIKKYKNHPGVKVFIQKMYCYYLNFIDIKSPIWGNISSKMLSFSEFKDVGSEAQKVRFLKGKIVLNGGWHFSYLGGANKISQKIKSFSHEEYNDDIFTNQENISEKIKKGFDLYSKKKFIRYVNFGDIFLPDYLLNNKAKYQDLFSINNNFNLYYAAIFLFNFLKENLFIFLKNIFFRLKNIFRSIFPSNRIIIKRILKKELLGCKSVIDLGCGKDSPLGLLKNEKDFNNVYSVGVDIFSPYLEKNIEINKIHSEYVNKNIFEIDYPENSFDVALLFDVIEHFNRENFINFLPKLEKMAKKIIIITPNGFIEQDEYDNNPFQKHLSGWIKKDFFSMGFKCYGLSGFKFFYKIKNQKLRTLLADFSQMFMFNIPDYSFHLLAIKNKK